MNLKSSFPTDPSGRSECKLRLETSTIYGSRSMEIHLANNVKTIGSNNFEIYVLFSCTMWPEGYKLMHLSVEENCCVYAYH